MAGPPVGNLVSVREGRNYGTIEMIEAINKPLEMYMRSIQTALN